MLRHLGKRNLLLRGKKHLRLLPLLRISRRRLRDCDLSCRNGILFREEVTAEAHRKMPEARLLKDTDQEVAFSIVGLSNVAWNPHWDAYQPRRDLEARAQNEK